MERRFISFHAVDLDPVRLRIVCASYFAYEHARTIRQVLIRRMLLLVLGIAVLTMGYHVLPIAALATAAVLAGVCVAVSVGAELKARRRLSDELRDVPRANPLETP